MQNIAKFLNDELAGFLHFLLEKNVFQTGLAFVLATQINNIFLQFVNTIVTPIVDKVVQKKTKAETTIIFGIEFKSGELSLALINFSLVLLFLYYLYKLSDSSKSLFQNLISNVRKIF
jgi:hypothetical protein